MRDMLKLLLGSAGGGVNPDDPALNRVLNMAAVFVAKEIMRATRRTLISSSTTINFAVGDQTKDVPADFARIISLRAIDPADTSRRVRFREIEEREATRYTQCDNIGSDGRILFYWKSHKTISLITPASEAFTAELNYAAVPAAVDPDDDGDDDESFSIPDMYHEAVVWRSVQVVAFADDDMVEKAAAMYQQSLSLDADVLESTRTGEFEGQIRRTSDEDE